MPSGCIWSTSTPHSAGARNRELLAGVVGELDVKVELSGGIRDDESLEAALATGCARVNLGTAAIEDPEWCARAIAEYGDRIAVGLDVKLDRRRSAACAGAAGSRDGGDLWEVLERLERDGCSRYVVTDVTKDGTLTGPNLELLRQVCAATDAPVVASGGVSTLEDLVAIAGLVGEGVEGAIVGKALYAGRFTLPEALAAVSAAERRSRRRSRTSPEALLGIAADCSTRSSARFVDGRRRSERGHQGPQRLRHRARSRAGADALGRSCSSAPGSRCTARSSAARN